MLCAALGFVWDFRMEVCRRGMKSVVANGMFDAFSTGVIAASLAAAAFKM